MRIKEKIAEQLPEWRERIARLRRDYGSTVVGEVTVDQIFGGIRGVQIGVSDISYVDPQQGVLLRGYTIPQVLELLPRAENSQFPLMGGLYYLLMVGEMPTPEEADEVENLWKMRGTIPPHVFRLINAMPVTTHPMTLFSQAILALQTESKFAHKYSNRLPRGEYWEYYLDDSLNLCAKLPAIAAYIYNYKYRSSDYLLPNPDLDWSANFAHMIGKGNDPGYMDLSRLFFVLHADHEGANVSAHASHLVCSALSDIYLSISAGMNGLAGPLHGLANQECLRWLLKTRDHFYDKYEDNPDRDALVEYLRDSLKHGSTIPGYGHAVLRITDPRFTAQLEFANRYLPNDDLLHLVKSIYDVLPGILKENGKVKNPYPNVDAINGTLQHHYGVREFDFYTVLFGVSRAVGLTAHAVWSRALGKPIERPKSLTTPLLENIIASGHPEAESD